MMEWIMNLLHTKTIKNLKEENEKLKKKLLESQENINKTNAYWKKKFYHKNSK